MENSYGLRDYRLEVNGDDLRGLGAIEGRVDRLVANRMKKRGMSWTILKPGLKLGCRLYMDHSKIVPGFKFSGTRVSVRGLQLQGLNMLRQR